MSRTKIVCTIGPASSSPGVIRGLVHAGMNVARINFSHGDYDTHVRAIATLGKVAEEEKCPLSVLADLQGPKLRVGTIEGSGMQLKVGSTVGLVAGSHADAATEIPVPHVELLSSLHLGDRVLLDDGSIELVVTRVSTDRLHCEVVIGGLLTSHKGINVPGAAFGISALTDKDQEDARFALEQGVDFIALSFVRGPDDVQELRRLLEKHDAEVPIIAKIEKREALDRFDEILSEADGIMVARGDLGVETPAEEVPFHQKQIIRACNQAGKPVVTATQMLQSMIASARPTRAEASDVVNAVLDGTDAVMLSGETAIGRYPVETTVMMSRICSNAEVHLACEDWLRRVSSPRESVSESISYAAVRIALDIGAKVIVTATMSGATARMVARFRPPIPILALTPNEAVVNHLALSWGVVPILVPRFASTDEMMELTTRVVAERRLAKTGERVVLTAGIPFGTGGKTNLLRVITVGEGDGLQASP
jgi:pyruvate kinase